jgi:hypothetical protein
MSATLETLTAYWTYVPITQGVSLGRNGSQLWFAKKGARTELDESVCVSAYGHAALTSAQRAASYVVPWQTDPSGTVAMRRPPTDWLKAFQSAGDGQQASPGKHLHDDEDPDDFREAAVAGEEKDGRTARTAIPKARTKGGAYMASRTSNGPSFQGYRWSLHYRYASVFFPHFYINYHTSIRKKKSCY